MPSTKQLRAQLEAAYVLLEGDTTTLEKFEKIKSLLMGINPDLDKKLEALTKHVSHAKAVIGGDIIHLTTHALSESTPQAKKCKKALLALITSWRSLKSEVGRVRGYTVDTASATTAGSVAKTALFAKGPFGLITLAAVAIVGVGLFLRQNITTISIENLGCPPLAVPKLPFTIPGLKLPTVPIISGTPAEVTLPALSVDVTASSTSISAIVLGQTGSYSLSSRVTDIRFDGKSLLNQTTTLDLSGRSHSLIISCN